MSIRSKIKRRHISQINSLDGSLHPVLQRVYAARGVESGAQLNYSLSAMLAAQMSGIEAACDLLAQTLRAEKLILVVGDFDADGATSTAVMLRALRMMGAARVDYLVPNRFDYGYGLSPEIVDVAAAREPALIVTVDNGISSLAGVDRANSLGIPVLVTDHHLPGEQLPAAAAIVNPNLNNDPFPSKSLAGVGVAFYLMAALRGHLRATDWFAEQGLQEPNLAELLDLVALGTVADVVPLDHNNRILVDQGLKRIRAGKCVPGISALLEVGKRRREKIVASDLGFAVAPRLNAAGRLEDISLGIECLLSDDSSRALELAQQLDQINHERRQIEQEMKQQAFAELEKLEASLERQAVPAGLCLYREDWHQGVVGILASRIKDRFHRPVIVFADEGNGQIKGSARSVQGVHIRDALEHISTRNPGLISKFGGHAMAAGLSMPLASLKPFREAFADYVEQQLGETVGEKVIYSDGELPADQLGIQLAELLTQAGPWGQSFPEPLFDGVFRLLDRRIVGEHHLKMTLEHPAGKALDAIAFNETGQWMNSQTRMVRIVYKLDVNEFRGQRSVQLMVEHIEPAE